MAKRKPNKRFECEIQMQAFSVFVNAPNKREARKLMNEKLDKMKMSTKVDKKQTSIDLDWRYA